MLSISWKEERILPVASRRPDAAVMVVGELAPDEQGSGGQTRGLIVLTGMSGKLELKYEGERVFFLLFGKKSVTWIPKAKGWL